MALGRPRKPSQIRELEGNRGHRDIPADLPLSGLPECPENLTGAAREHFNFIAAELSAIGVTKRLDTSALAVLASLWAMYWEAVEAKDINATVKLVAKWASLAGRFGLTPADRARIMAGTTSGSVDPTEARYFGVVG